MLSRDGVFTAAAGVQEGEDDDDDARRPWARDSQFFTQAKPTHRPPFAARPRRTRRR